MPSYVVTGANRGLGLAFVKHLSQDPDNVVVGLVRDKAAADARMTKEGIKNVTIIQADITDRPALDKAASEVSKLTGGTLNYLINNAAYISQITATSTLLDFVPASATQELTTDILKSIETNVLGVLNTINAFISLILSVPSTTSQPGKVITLTTGLGDLDATNAFSLPITVPYSISKAAVNMLIAKYQSAYLDQGVLFLSISPGVVATNENSEQQQQQQLPKAVQDMFRKFMEYEPKFQGPMKPEESVKLVLKVVEEKSLEKGDGGETFSHWGNKRWL